MITGAAREQFAIYGIFHQVDCVYKFLWVNWNRHGKECTHVVDLTLQLGYFISFILLQLSLFHA